MLARPNISLISSSRAGGSPCPLSTLMARRLSAAASAASRRARVRYRNAASERLRSARPFRLTR